MTTNNFSDGVGKKIVEALKQQSDMEIQNVVETPVYENNNVHEYYEPQVEPTFISPEPINFTQNDSFASELDDFEIPANIAVLKHLINQLPAGVSKQTGAQIIKQTMEAMGTSMKGVLQEAQQVQDNINNSAKECQNSIVEHKKQIGILERQSQKLQRQYLALNDIISLFVQTNI